MTTTPIIKENNVKIGRHQMSSYGPSSALMEESYDDSGSAFQRPRRPNADTLSYCKVLPLSVQIAQTELKEFEYQINTMNNEQNDTDKHEKNTLDIEEMIQTYIPSRLAAQSAIEEIQNEIASLAGDDEASAIIETLAKIVSISFSSSPSNPIKNDSKSKGNDTMSFPPDSESITKMMSGLKGYHLHLSTHRYGSHVLQTILQCAGKCLKANDDPQYSNENNTEASETLAKLIKNVSDELIPHTRELAVHVCGSHVLRTLLHVLAGVEVDEKNGSSPALRGKPKKKKKKKFANPNMGQNPLGGGKNVSNPLLKYHQYKDNDVVQLFQKCLSDFTNAFIYDKNTNDNKPDGDINSTLSFELQTLVCHPSAGPLLSILLRVLCIMEGEQQSIHSTHSSDAGCRDRDYRLLGILPPEPQYQPESTADKLVKAMICWESDENNNTSSSKDPSSSSTKSGNIIYGLSGEPTGSIFLETILRSCASNEFYSEFCERAGFFSADNLRDYTTHNVSNFVIQTLLVTCRTKEQAELLCKGLMPCLTSNPKQDSQNDHVANDKKEASTDEKNDTSLPLLLQKKRRGVLFRLTELCAKWKIGQETLLKGICTGFAIEESNPKGERGDQDNDQKGEETSDKSKTRKKKKKLQSIPMDQCIRKLMDLDTSDSVAGAGRISLDTNGARTIYHMLHFVPRLCADILDTFTNQFSADEIEKMAMDGVGSRCILDAILSNPSTSIAPFPSTINNLLTQLQGRWTSLSVDRVGHHTVKKMFHALSTLDQKLILVQELGQAGMNRLSGNAMGRAVIDECSIHDFMRGGEYTWRDVVSKKMKQKEWLKDLAEEGGDEVEKPSKKRRKRKKRVGESGGANSEEGKKENLPMTSVVNSIMDTLIMNTSSLVPPLKENFKSEDGKSKRSRKRKRKKVEKDQATNS